MKQDQDIELTIDKIVLHGFASKDSKGLKEAIQFELGRLINERGLPAEIRSGGTFEHLPGGNVSIKTGGSLKTLASKISNHVYNGFSESKIRK
ncbi:MAG: outer membrane protein/protective antigen [Mucilaginibacter sp.]|nr:outer membrane protein/protective antigen [Mucilaginibacter sp.]